MDNDWTEFCYSPDFLEESDVRARERLRCPSPRVARKDLHRIAASVTRDDKRLVQAAFDWSVKADARSSRIVRLFHCVIDSLGLSFGPRCLFRQAVPTEHCFIRFFYDHADLRYEFSL